MNTIKLNNINIRTTLLPGDIGYVIYMHGRLYQEEYSFGVSFETYVAKGLFEFYQHYNATLDRVWIAEHNRKIIGFLLLMHREPGVAQLRYFIIHPDFRGIGLGKKLTSLYLEQIKAIGYNSTYLLTTNEQIKAVGIYLKMGFQLTNEFASNAFGKALKEQRYDWNLAEFNKEEKP